MTKDHICLLSGGMDSSTVLATVCHNFLADRVLALGFYYGQRHGEQELSAAQEITRQLQVDFRVIDLATLTPLLQGSALTDPSVQVPEGHYEAPSMKKTVVPNRNAIMLSIAFGVARGLGARAVYAGMHDGDHAIYPDCRPEFMGAFERMEHFANVDLEANEIPRLFVPFLGIYKKDIVKQAIAMGLDLSLTYSCYKGEPTHCGVCGTCVERREAFLLAGVDDPTKYKETKALNV